MSETIPRLDSQAPWLRDFAAARIASPAAAMVLSTSFAVCAADRNHASNCDGGGYTPRASIARKNRAYRSVLALVADR